MTTMDQDQPPLDLSTITIQSRQVTEVGIKLPYVQRAYRTNEVVESGTIFITIETLCELAHQATFDSYFGRALYLRRCEGLALEQAGLAVHETRGGYHRTAKLLTFLANLQH